MFAEYAKAYGKEVEVKKPLDQQIQKASDRTNITETAPDKGDIQR